MPQTAQESEGAAATRIGDTSSKDTALVTDPLPKLNQETATPGGTSSTPVVFSSPQAARKTVESEFIALKQGLRRLVLGVERFEKLLAEENLVSGATAAASLIGRQDAGPQGQSRSPRGRGPRFLQNAQIGKAGRRGYHHPIRQQWDLVVSFSFLSFSHDQWRRILINRRLTGNRLGL